MNRPQLFLKDIEKLKNLSDGNHSEYDTMQIALLLRKLLIDGGNLVDQVNRVHRAKIEFSYFPFDMPDFGIDFVFLAQMDGFDPNTNPRADSAQPLTTSKAKLLNSTIAKYKGTDLTVHGLIDHVAHISGAVHAGKPRSEQEKQILELEQSILVGNMSSAVKSLQAIARVVVRGLLPLTQAVEKSAQN